MKKNVLALSITAALVGLTGGAHAMTGALDGATAGTELKLNGDGFGHFLLVPYFTTQDKNNTLINIVNTSTTVGKAVKVRFRGAANSDDLFDFQVFLSPGDVWSANISKNASGQSQLTTSDASCTKPDKGTINSTPFLTTRLDTTMTADQKTNGTREGYVEIFNMGDIPKLLAGPAAVADIDYIQTTAGVDATVGATINPLYTAIKHVSKVPPCSGAAWTFLDTTNLQWSAAGAAANTPRSAGLLPPTTGLIANWTVINVVSAAAWSGEAVAVQSVVNATGVASTGNVVYWPQTGALVGGAGVIDLYSADPLLRTDRVGKFDGANYITDTAPGVAAGFFDLPDFSTPYTRNASTLPLPPYPYTIDSPLFQAQGITASIAASAVTNEYLTDTSISATTDWVFSQPTRRYNVAFKYNATISATDDGRRFSDIVTKAAATPAGTVMTGAFVNGYFLQQNTLIGVNTNFNGRQICTKNIAPASFDREETGVLAPTVVVISPSTPADPLSFCGEATVLSINNGGIVSGGTGSLKASVAVKDLDAGFRDGWLRLGTPAAAPLAGAVNGLPMVGAAFVRAFSGTQSFGATYNHRLSR